MVRHHLLLRHLDQFGQPEPPSCAHGNTTQSTKEESRFLLRQSIDFVEHEQLGQRVEFERLQEFLDGGQSGVQSRIRGVDDVQEKICVGQLLESRPECSQEIRRKIGDEADRVGDDHFTLPGKAQSATGRVERHEQLVGRRDLGVGERIEKRALAGIGIADDRQDRQGRLSTSPPTNVALA